MIDIYDRAYQPSLEEIYEYVDNALFEGMVQEVVTAYKAMHEVMYSGDKVLLGWNVCLRKGGRTLCRLYPRRGYYSVLVVIGQRERERAEVLLPEMSAEAQHVYRDTREGMGQRWLLFDLHAPDALYRDVLRLVRIRRES